MKRARILLAAVVFVAVVALPVAALALIPVSRSGAVDLSESRSGEFLFSNWDTMYRLPFAGGRPQKILAGRFDYFGDVAWSANGRRIAFTCGDSLDDTGICVADRDGKHLREITLIADTGGFGSYSPQWSPDGSRVAFVEQEGSEGAFISVFDFRSDRTSKILGAGLRYVSIIAWSKPDTIWFMVQEVGAPTIPLLKVHPDGTAKRRVRIGIAYVSDVSADGTRVVGSTRDGSLVVANADGSGRKRLAAREVLSPRWSADGRSIAWFVSICPAVATPTPSCPGELRAMTLATGAVRRIARLPSTGDTTSMDWFDPRR